MSSKLVVFFIILAFIIVIPIAYAQEITIGEKAEQKSVEVVISSADKIHVKHVIISQIHPSN